MKKIFLLLLFLGLYSYGYTNENIKLGVFAYKGVEQTKIKYQPLVDLLNEKLNNRVVLEVLTQEDINKKIKNNELDFITTNPIHFLQLRQELELSGPIATIRSYNNNIATDRLAGVIIVKKNSSIKELKDLKNKVIATPSTKHLGGFRTQAYELYLLDIDIFKDSENIIEMKSSHQKVVQSVLAGRVDVGFIRDSILEDMLELGEIKEDDIRVINEQTSDHPYKTSTRLYPEWPLFAMPHVNKKSAKEFATALLTIQPTQKLQDEGIYDYILPVDYLETEVLSRTLRLPPFDKTPQITYADILNQYKIVILAVALLVMIALLYHYREQKRKDLIDSLLSNIGEGVYGIDNKGRCTWINKKALELIGYSEKEVLGQDQHCLFHHHTSSGKKYALEKCPIYLTSKDKKTRNVNENFIKKDGSFIPISLTVTPIKNGGAIVVFRDMSDFIEKKEKLKKSESLFRTLFELSPEAIVITDPETKLPYKYNKAAHTQLGYSADEFKKISIEQYINFDSIEVEKHIKSVFENNEGFFETIQRTKDGLHLDINIAAKPIYIDHKQYILSIHRDLTEIKNYQRDLKYQKERLTYIIEGTNIGTWEWNIKTNDVIFNEKWAEMVGYTLEELTPTSIDTWTAFTHPEDLIKSQELLKKHFRGESEFYECDARMKHKDGHWIWVLDRGKVSKWNEHGEPLIISGTHQDITIKKAEKEKLENLNNQMETLIQSIPDLVWMKDREGLYITCNKRFEDFFGASREEISGKTDYDFVPSELADSFRMHDEKAMYSNKPLTNFEEISFAKDGHNEFLQTTKVSVRDNKGEIVGVLGIGRDITQIKENEKELLEREKLLDLFFRQSMYGFFFMMLDEPIEWNDSIDKEKALEYVFDHQRITKINKAMLLQYGATEEDFIGMTPKEFFSHDLKDGQKLWRDFFDRGQLHIDTKEKRLDGSEITINGVYICLYDDRGFIRGHFGVQRDVTKEIEARASIQKAKEEAERANKSKSAFLANMSHEIRTPMNAILGLSKIVLETNLNEKQAEYIDKINNSSKMLLNIINDILDFSKIEANKLEIENREFKIEKIFAKLEALFQQIAQDKGIKFYYDVEENTPNMIVADELRITQVIVNLVSNAIKFTQEGSVQVALKVSQRDENKATLVFSVNDTGVGLNQEQTEKLFKPFSQADNSITRKYGGSGLGLSISSGLVTAMNGKIDVKSKEGVGSTFSFEIEVDVNSWLNNTLDLQNIETSVEVEKHIDYPDLSHIKLLLVEDNAINQEIAIEALKRVKITPDVANNGSEAVDIFIAKPNHYDIILMDIQMPIMSGYEATQIIRKYGSDIPIIAFTAAAMIEDKNKALDAGMNEHISKPIDTYEMLSSIVRCLNIDFDIAENSYISKAEDSNNSEYYGVDIEDLKNRTGDNPEIIKQLLLSFCQEYKSPEMIFNLENIESESFASAIHSLKGVSGNISLYNIYALSKKIYETKDISIKKELIPKLIDLLKETTSNLLATIEQNSDESKLEIDYDISEVKIFLKELLDDLDHSTAISQQRVDTLVQMLEKEVKKEDISIIKNHLLNYEYIEASAKIRAIYNELRV